MQEEAMWKPTTIMYAVLEDDVVHNMLADCKKIV
jgi:hypothetical protein